MGSHAEFQIRWCRSSILTSIFFVLPILEIVFWKCFSVYLKWNERLFQEVYKAYEEGRGSDTDPSEGWYKGELGFFDFYIVPLAKKLKECGVFGVSSDEYLNYALANRKEWEQKGHEIVKGYVRDYHAKTA